MVEKTARFLRPSNFEGLAEEDDMVSIQKLVEMDNVDKRVGEEIKHLRKARNTTLDRLSKRTGISPGYLSQIENGKANPSVKALHSISQALGVNISWFFFSGTDSEEEVREYVVRKKNRRSLKFRNGIVDELLSPNLGRKLEMLRCIFPPGCSSGEESYWHEGEEAGVIVSGQLHLWIGDKHVVLEEGDSFAFESYTPHRYENRSDTDTIVVWSITPPSY